MIERPQGGFAPGVKAWLDRRIKERYDLAKLARAFDVSPRTLLRRFGAEAGESPLTYLQGARIDKAKLLPESIKLSVAQVPSRPDIWRQHFFRSSPAACGAIAC